MALKFPSCMSRVRFPPPAPIISSRREELALLPLIYTFPYVPHRVPYVLFTPCCSRASYGGPGVVRPPCATSRSSRECSGRSSKLGYVQLLSEANRDRPQHHLLLRGHRI